MGKYAIISARVPEGVKTKIIIKPEIKQKGTESKII